MMIFLILILIAIYMSVYFSYFPEILLNIFFLIDFDGFFLRQ